MSPDEEAQAVARGLPHGALKFSGDRTATIHVGQAMGPGVDGLYRRVTAVEYNEAADRTRVELERVDLAPDGHRLRYYGNDDGGDELPAERVPLQEEADAQ